MNTISKKSLLIYIAFVAFLTVLPPRLVSAANPTTSTPERVCLEVPLPNLPGLPADPCSSPAAYIQYWFYFALYLAGVAALLMLVAGGVMYMISATVPGAGKGTKYITNASLGLILLFGSYLLLRTLGGGQFSELKNPQLPSLPNCAIDFSPIPATAGAETKMKWKINQNGPTEKAVDTTITCTNPGRNIASQPLKGELALTPLTEGLMSCTFKIHDTYGTPLHECTATADVLAEVKIASCALTKDDRNFFWTPALDIKQWNGTLTCDSNGSGLLDCSNSACTNINEKDPSGTVFLHVSPSGTCTLDAVSKAGQKVSCSTSWGDKPPALPSCAITFSPTPTTIGTETKMDWTIDKNGTAATKTNITCTNPDLNITAQSLTGEQKFTPAAEGKTNCTFDIQDANNTSLNKCTAEVNVSPKAKASSCTLTHTPSVISWSPDFDTNIPDPDKRKWTGNLTCQEKIIKCPLSPVSQCDLTAWRGGASALLVDDTKGNCTLAMQNKETKETASCSVSWTK